MRLHNQAGTRAVRRNVETLANVKPFLSVTHLIECVSFTFQNDTKIIFEHLIFLDFEVIGDLWQPLFSKLPVFDSVGHPVYVQSTAFPLCTVTAPESIVRETLA